MSTADAWGHDGHGGGDSWSRRTRFAPTDIVTLLLRQWKLMAGIFIVIFALGLAYALTLKSNYTAYSSLTVGLGQDYVYQPRIGDAGRGAVPEQDAVVASEVEILGSAGVKERVLNRLGVAAVYPKIAAANADPATATAKAVHAMEKAFETETAPDLPTIRMSFKHEDPRIAAEVLNAIMEEYLVYRRAILRETNAPALQIQRERSENELRSVDSAYQAFLNMNDLGDFDAEKNSLTLALADREQQRYAIAAQMREAQGRLAALNSQRGGQAAEIAVYRDLNLASSQALDAARQQRAELLSRYLPDSEPVKAIDRRIVDLQAALASTPAAGDSARRMGPNPVLQNLESDRIAAAAQVSASGASLAAVNSQIDQITRRLQELARLQPEFQRLARQRDLLQTNVTDFSRREQESLASEAIAMTSEDDIRIVSRATPPIQGASNKKIVAALAILLGGFVALCAGLLTIFLRPGIPTATAAGRTLELPVLGSAAVKR